MKAVLIIPSWRPEEIFPGRTAGSQINYWQPLGTLYVASALREAGHSVTFLNGAFLSHGEILRRIREEKPDVAGLYSTAFGWPRAMKTARDIKKISREILTVTGGPYPTALKENCLRDCPDMDAAVYGEGEITLVEALDRISKGMPLDGVKGLCYREGGSISANPPRPFIPDQDSIPFPARELLGGPEKYMPPPATYRRKPVAVMMTSRGCNRHCIYCFQMDRRRAGGIRYRSIDNVLKEMELCSARGYREIKFLDDTIAADYGRALELAQEIRRRKTGLVWFASACVNQVDGRLLRAFKDAGCWAVLMGAESGVQKNLNALRKGITLDQTRRAVRAAKNAGLRVFTPFLFGIPGETYEEALKTIDFAVELDPDIANFHALTPFPGTDLYDRHKEYGTVSRDLSDYTYQGAAFVPHTLTRSQIAGLRQAAFRRFYSRPRYILKRLLMLRTLDDLRAALKGARSLLALRSKGGLFRPRKLSGAGHP